MHRAWPKKDNLKNEDNLINEDDLKNEDDLQNEDNLKKEHDLKNDVSECLRVNWEYFFLIKQDLSFLY